MTNDELNAAATAFLKELYADIGEEMPQLGDQQQATAVEEKPEPAEKNEIIGYGYCPQCGSPGVSRERRINGNDQCGNGHVYPSRASLKSPQPATKAKRGRKKK